MMCLGYATHLANFGVTVTHHTNTQRRGKSNEKMIDGIPTTVQKQGISSAICPSPSQGKNPWVQLDLKKVYLVSLVRAIIYGRSGKNVVVRVGNSLTNNGSDNHQCGIFPFVDDD